MKHEFPDLKTAIKAKKYTQEQFAEALGTSRYSLHLKLEGRCYWVLNEVLTACRLLGIKEAEISHYFGGNK